MKIFAHRESINVHARYAKMPGEKFLAPDYDPLLALHWVKDVTLTEIGFAFPKDYDFDRAMNRQFGVIHAGRFAVKAVFTGWAAGTGGEVEAAPVPVKLKGANR